MAATALPAGGIALHGAPDNDRGSTDAKHAPLQAMQLELSQEMVDELLESVHSGKPPQLFFGRTPQLRYGSKSHTLQTSSESNRYELYKSSGPGSDAGLEFAGLISHSLAVQKAEEVTAGVDTALEQLRSSMAAISEFKEANKTIVGDAGRVSTPSHRRVPSKGFRAGHLAPSTLGSPLLSAPSSPMLKAPTSQPADKNHDVLLRALRVPLIHLLAVQPARDSYLAETCRAPVAMVGDLLPKIAKPSQDSGKWQLTDKSFRELNPWKFAYKDAEDRERAINNAIKSFDRLRLPKDDKLWQILLPTEERGQGKCLSRLNVKPLEHKPATPLHSLKLGTDKKATAAKRVKDNNTEREPKKTREVKVKEAAEAKPTKAVKENAVKSAREGARKPTTNGASQAAAPQTSSATPDRSFTSTAHNKPTAPSHRHTPSTEEMGRIHQKKVMVPKATTITRVEPTKNVGPQRDRTPRPAKPVRPLSTKPKNPSPLSVSPPVNASDFEDSHPVHKALSGAPSPAKTLSGNSDRSLKRKANDIDSGIHDHFTTKQARVDRPTPANTPSTSSGRGTTATPSSDITRKRKADDMPASDAAASKARKVTNGGNKGLANGKAHSDAGKKSLTNGNTKSSAGKHDDPSASDSESSESSESSVRLSWRATILLAQNFKQCYQKYETLYWKLAEGTTPPTDAERAELNKMHRKLSEMKHDLNKGAEAREKALSK